MKIRLVDTSNPEVESALRWLQVQTLPGDEVIDPSQGDWWIGRDGHIPAAFIALLDVTTWPEAAYVARCGVLEQYRGQRLQRRMLSALERRARALGLKFLVSTTYRNPHSANNFIACGYVTYEPQTRWGAEDTIYWLKELA